MQNPPADKAPTSRNPGSIRERAFARLCGEEQERAKTLLPLPSKVPAIPFRALTRAYERVLYALAAVDEAVSPAELVYLLAAYWNSATDAAAVQRRIALAVQQGEVLWDRHGGYRITDDGMEHLRSLERELLRDDTSRRRTSSAPARGRGDVTRPPRVSRDQQDSKRRTGRVAGPAPERRPRRYGAPGPAARRGPRRDRQARS